MKGKIIIATVIGALFAIPVFAAAANVDNHNGYYPMLQRHQQMIQNAVDNGTITQEQAQQMNENMQQMAPVMQQMMQKRGGMMGKNGRHGYGPCSAAQSSADVPAVDR